VSDKILSGTSFSLYVDSEGKSWSAFANGVLVTPSVADTPEAAIRDCVDRTKKAKVDAARREIARLQATLPETAACADDDVCSVLESE
jgi:hypothetical protein